MAIYGNCPVCGGRYKLKQFGPKLYLRKHFQHIPRTNATLGVMGNIPARKIRCPGSGKAL